MLSARPPRCQLFDALRVRSRASRRVQPFARSWVAPTNSLPCEQPYIENLKSHIQRHADAARDVVHECVRLEISDLQGHEFGLRLPASDKAALIAFLRTSDPF